MANILTLSGAAETVRTNQDDILLQNLLPLVDKHVQSATGRDWTQDTTIHPTAKSAARMLLAQWYDNPAQMGTDTPLAFGLMNVLSQLEAEALKYRKYQFYGLQGTGGIFIRGASVGDQVQKLVGVYGVSGDQSSKFESTVSVVGQIQQTNSGDLSTNIYVVILKSPAADVGA